jgi:hypothetical protein
VHNPFDRLKFTKEVVLISDIDAWQLLNPLEKRDLDLPFYYLGNSVYVPISHQVFVATRSMLSWAFVFVSVLI